MKIMEKAAYTGCKMLLRPSVSELLQRASDSFYMSLANAGPYWQAHYCASDCFSDRRGMANTWMGIEVTKECGQNTRIENGRSDTCLVEGPNDHIPWQRVNEH